MPLAIFEWRALQFVSLVAVMVWKFSCLSSASLCNSTPHCFKDDKSQQEIKMKQWWFLVVFCSNLEAFHLQGSISQYGERLWLELVLLNGTTGNLTFTNDFGRGKQESRYSPCLAKGRLVNFCYILTARFWNVGTVWDLSLSRLQRRT